MIQASTALLLALMVHLGGVDVDSFASARLQWYRDSELVTEWQRRGNLQAASVYHFSDGEELVLVERLRGTEHTYAVVQYDHHSPSPSALPRATAIVSLRQMAAQLRPGSDAGGTLRLAASRAIVAWSPGEAAVDGEPESPSDTTDGSGAPSAAGAESRDPAAVNPAPAPDRSTPDGLSGDMIVTRQQRGITIAHPSSGQVLTLVFP